MNVQSSPKSPKNGHSSPSPRRLNNECADYDSHVTVCIFDISLNKYGCHTANISHTAIILNGHTNQKFLDTCAKTQQTAIPTSHLIVTYVPKTNIPLKCHLHAIYVN